MSNKMTLQDDYYRDCMGKVMFLYALILASLALIIALALYFFIAKPKPVVFNTYDSFRIQPDVPLNQTYLSQPALLQWVSDVMPRAFTFNFVHYTQQLQQAQAYFTENGWRGFVNHLNVYANPNLIQADRLFITASIMGAPAILKQGLFGVRAAWLVQMPIMISYAGNVNMPNRTLTLQILVVRVSTLNNLSGVGIENVVVLKSVNNPY